MTDCTCDYTHPTLPLAAPVLITDKLSQVLTFRDRGADPTGANDATDQIQAVIEYAEANGDTLYPERGLYNISDELVISSSALEIRGRGKADSVIKSSAAKPIIRLDLGTQSQPNNLNDVAITGMTLEHTGSDTTGRTGILASGWGYLKDAEIEENQILGNAYGIRFDIDCVIASGQYSITHMAFNDIKDNRIFSSVGGVWFDHGPGNHSIIDGNYIHMTGSGTTTGYPIRMGDGVIGVGDIEITNNQLMLGAAGIRIYGPADPAEYSRRMFVVGNQIEVAGAPLHFSRMSFFTDIGNTSASTSGSIFDDCNNFTSLQHSDMSTMNVRRFNIPANGTTVLGYVKATKLGASLPGSGYSLEVSVGGYVTGVTAFAANRKFVVHVSHIGTMQIVSGAQMETVAGRCTLSLVATATPGVSELRATLSGNGIGSVEGNVRVDGSYVYFQRTTAWHS